MKEERHGFCTREAWTAWLAAYNTVLVDLNESSYELITSELPANEWIARHKNNSIQVREAYQRNEEMLEYHVRWFTRTPGRWTREAADPLLAALFRYVTRLNDLGTAYEIAESLLAFYGSLEDDIAMMKCYMVRAFSCGFLDPIHLADEVNRDCRRAQAIYERSFDCLTDEEKSMGLSIYDLEFDQMTNLLKLGRATPELLEEMIGCGSAGNRATACVMAADRGYEFNRILPDFDYYLSFGALCLSPGECIQRQAEVIRLASERQRGFCEMEQDSLQCRRRINLMCRMAQRLTGQCTDEEALLELKGLVEDTAHPLFMGNSYDQEAVETVEVIQLAAETLTRGGAREPELYGRVQKLVVRYFATLPYDTFVDYVCASYNYCYVLATLPHIKDQKELLHILLKLTMFRQVQTAMHSIMVAKLAAELLDSIIRNRPELLVGQLKTTAVKEVRERAETFRQYLYCGALLHDIGKILCSSVINAQSRRLSELEFRVLGYHPVTGGEMLERLPGLSVFRDIAIGHHKSFDGTSGYPMEFDNTASPQKIFIDIITICDSLDAATDHLGRNYTVAKDFFTVLGELTAGRGTRYCGEIVDLLEKDETLQGRVRHLVGEGRRDVYYDVHKMISLEPAACPADKKARSLLPGLEPMESDSRA